jgi:hypothetical protein
VATADAVGFAGVFGADDTVGLATVPPGGFTATGVGARPAGTRAAEVAVADAGEATSGARTGSVT